MNCITFEIYRSGHEILVEVDPVDDTTGYVVEDVPCWDASGGTPTGILFFEGFPVDLTRAERAEARELLLEANPVTPCGSRRRPDRLTAREEDLIADAYFAGRL